MAVYTLRPNAVGDLAGCSPFPADAINWDKVDEATTDEDVTYVSNPGFVTKLTDLYNFEPLAIGAGTITKVQVNIRHEGGTGLSPDFITFCRIKTGGTVYTSGGSPKSATYIDFYDYWTTNPNTGIAWTISEVNALQAGPALGITPARCTQFYLTVTVTDPTYVFPFDPMTRVTALVHRYDNNAGIYQLEMSLGDVTSVFAHSYELGARRATASKELVQETGRIFDVAKDERLLRKIPPEFTETRVVDANGQDVTKLWRDFWSNNYQQVEKMVSDYFKRVTGGTGEKIK